MNHQERVKTIGEAFTKANTELLADIEALDDAMAAAKRGDGWNPAQIGWHVALTSEFLSGAISGDIPQVNVAKPADFNESLATLQLPAKIKTFSRLEPPEEASRAEALDRLKASADTFSAAVKTITVERCASTAVQLPFGVFSIYEVGEFTAVHIRRHIGQLRRTIGQE